MFPNKSTGSSVWNKSSFLFDFVGGAAGSGGGGNAVEGAGGGGGGV